MNDEEFKKADDARRGCLGGCGCLSLCIMVGGGILMATLYEKHQPLDTRALWILGSMVAPFPPLALMILLWPAPKRPQTFVCPKCIEPLSDQVVEKVRLTGVCPYCDAKIDPAMVADC